MRVLKNRRFYAAVLSAALMCSMCLSAFAAPSSFRDITDDTVAVNADVLRLMGVVNGVGDNHFNPDANLTRAEFCVMVTRFIQRGDEVAQYAARTIFSDVTGRHWARGYINLMATPDGSNPAMISGVGNGSFAPDQQVTVAQAVTVLLRVLGYTSKETGFIWPESYMNFADSIALTDGVPTTSGAAITRAQAAQLFVNALSCKTQSGSPYYRSLGNTNENTILLAVNVASDDGSSAHAIRTSLNGESFLAASGDVSPYALQGKRGALVLNDRNEIVTFLPDDSNSITVTLSGNAQPSYLKGSNGTRYTMSPSTLLYTADRAAGMNYIEGYTSLRSGSRVTLFTHSGKITAVYAAGSTDSGTGAVVVAGKADENDFYQLTGGANEYSIVKNGQTITMQDIQPNDVVTYDRVNNALNVSDLRLRGIYQDASPNADAPTSITLLGTKFEVLDSAWDNMDAVKIGDTVSVLLTCDGKVAGIKKASTATRANAVALADTGSLNVFLPNGSMLPLSVSVEKGSKLAGQLVTVTGQSDKNTAAVSPLSQSDSGTFDLEKMTLGNKLVCAGVRVFDQVKGSIPVEVDLTSLPDQLTGKNIKSYHTNSSGHVDFIVLDNFTGSAYRYGLCVVSSDTEEDLYVNFENGTGSAISGLKTVRNLKNNRFYGIAVGNDGSIKSHVELEQLKNISPADFYERQGELYLEHEGEHYPVSDDVVCYKTVNKLWFTNETGAARLAACKAFSENLSAYYDPFVGHIRIVTAN